MEFLEASIFQKGYIDGITVLNLDGEILFSAKFNKKLSNLDEAQQLIGQNFLDVYPNLTPQSSTLYRAMQFGRPVYEEKQYLKKRGKDGILITSISFPIKNGDRIVGAIDLSMQESEEEEDGLPNSRIELSRDSFQRDRTQKLSTSASAAFRTEDIIAVNQKMCQAKDYISVVASCDLPVMLCGRQGQEKTSLRRRSITPARAGMDRLSPKTVPRSRIPCWRASCLVRPRVPSPVRWRVRGFWNWPTTVRFFWMS